MRFGGCVILVHYGKVETQSFLILNMCLWVWRTKNALHATTVMTHSQPRIILLFSGKRKSGKDYVADLIQHRWALVSRAQVSCMNADDADSVVVIAGWLQRCAVYSDCLRHSNSSMHRYTTLQPCSLTCVVISFRLNSFNLKKVCICELFCITFDISGIMHSLICIHCWEPRPHAIIQSATGAQKPAPP